MEIKLSSNALEVLKRRYLRKDENGKVIETPEQMFRRVARNIAEADLIYDKNADVKGVEEDFFELMASLDFLPNSPTLMNAGAELQQLSACFVLPIDDSMESIFETLKNAALIHKSGGGTGFSFSRLRPKNDVVKSTGGVASGPVSFMKVFDASTEAIKQGGTRRGANMGILRVDHPDIMEFITCKADGKTLQNFNISVAVTDEFMEKVKNNENYPLINPRNKKIVKWINAREIFDKIVEMAWLTGDPGVVFIDRVNEANPTPKLGMIESTNPCGEQPLLPYESCNLGSINLANMIKDGDIDWDKLRDRVHKAVHFLDNVIDANKFPIKKIEEMTKANRKIGLGVMGFADLLVQLWIPYDSDEALQIAEKIMKFIKEEAVKASVQLAEKRGVFPNFEMSIYKDGGPRLRNATLTTIAPTGTISMIADCSSGIEPIFALTYIKKVMEGKELIYVNKYFEKVARERGFYSKELMRRIAENKGSVQGISEVPKDVQRVFVTAHDISPEWHVKMQAAFQKYVDNAVSKTINFRHEASVDDIRKAYLLAYELRCKGITVYRDGCKEDQVIFFGKKEKKREGVEPKPRPLVLKGTTIKMRTGCGNLYVTINEDENGNMFEVFAQLGKAGGCTASQTEAISRLISLCLRSGVNPKVIIEQLKDIRCEKPIVAVGGTVYSCADAIAKAMEKFLRVKKEGLGEIPAEVTLDTYSKSTEKAFRGLCPDCGFPLIYEEGCEKCLNCGYSKCG